MATTPSLSSLLTTVSEQQAFQALLQYYQVAGFPTTTWEPGDIDETRMQAFAAAINAYVTNYLPAVAGGSLLDYAPNYPGWTALTAQQIYNLLQNAATNTAGTMTATNVATTPYAFSAGQLYAVFGTSGNRYINTSSGTIPASGSLAGIAFQAENPGAAYNDPSNSGDITLVTPLPGVTMSNPAGSFSGITHTGSGTGTITLGGSPVGGHSVQVNITATSASSPASVSYNLDGAPAVSVGQVSSFAVGGTGITVTLVNGASGTSWVQGDTYSFSTPGSWITSQGADAETDLALAQRCRNRWASLSLVPTASLYQLLAQSTPDVGAQVTQVSVVPDLYVNNKINVIVSGPGGVLPSATISLIQNYITPRARGCDSPVVQSPTTEAITIAGTVTANASQLTNAQGAVTTALQDYVAGIPVNGTLRISAIIELIMLVSGVIDVTGLTINGSAVNLTLGAVSTYVLPAYPPTLNLTWQTL